MPEELSVSRVSRMGWRLHPTSMILRRAALGMFPFAHRSRMPQEQCRVPSPASMAGSPLRVFSWPFARRLSAAGQPVSHCLDWRESLPRSDQRFEAGDHIEQFLVDATLAQTMECPVEVLQ